MNSGVLSLAIGRLVDCNVEHIFVLQENEQSAHTQGQQAAALSMDCNTLDRLFLLHAL